MAHGLRIWNGSGQVIYDTPTAVGGVCLGFVNVPPNGGTFTFPGIVGRSGVALYCGDGGGLVYTWDNSLGYLRFVFTRSYGSTPAAAALFAR